jgi:hypothetical protein
MEKEETVSPDYQTGFNEGYTIAKYNPELAGQLSKISVESERFTGFQQGREQFIKEQVKDKLPSWVKGNTIQKGLDTIGKKIEKGINKDIEPER